MNFLLGIVASSKTALVFVIDSFNRANNSTSLGSVSGQIWRIWRGAWQILSNKAYSDTTASSNALATLTFTKTDVTVSISGQDPGMGAAFWVTDADNWYASVYTQTQVCQTCVDCTGNFNSPTCIGNVNAPVCNANCCNGFFPTWSPYCSGSWNASTCNQNSQNGPANIFNSANSGNGAPPYGFPWGPSRNWVCTGNFNTSNCITAPGNCNVSGVFCCAPTSTYLTPGNCNLTAPGNCNQFFSYSCNCTTEHRINLIRSIAGTISTISQNLFSATIASFRTLLSGNQASITAFSAINYSSQIGNTAVTSISPAPIKTNRHGIIKSSSPFSQGTSIDDFGVS
jgi:hypothetical protein